MDRKKKIQQFFDEDDLVKVPYEPPQRKINQVLFHGSGAFSQVMWKVVLQRLHEGHSLLSGLQQGDDDPNTEEYIKDVIRDILASFGYSDTGLQYRKLPQTNRKKPTLNQLTLEEQMMKFYDNKIGGPNGDKWIDRKEEEKFNRFMSFLDDKDYL